MDKIISMIGLAEKAGKVVSGEFMTEKSIKEGKASLVVVAKDASDNTKKMFLNMCTFRKIPYYLYGTKEALGHGIGKEVRASLAILDEGFRKAIEKKLNESGNQDAKISEEMG